MKQFDRVYLANNDGKIQNLSIIYTVIISNEPQIHILIYAVNPCNPWNQERKRTFCKMPTTAPQWNNLTLLSFFISVFISHYGR